MNIKDGLIITIITFIIFLYLIAESAGSNNNTDNKNIPVKNTITKNNEDRILVENSQCAKEINKFTEKDDVWKSTFIYHPEEICLVLKNNIWYDLYNDKIIMEQKL